MALTTQSIIARAVVANMTRTSEQINASVLNLSGGVRTNAGTADFAVGSVLASNSSTLSTANINAGQGKSLLQTAQGGLDQILELLQDQKDLATKSADASLTSNERSNLNLEFAAITSEIDRLANNTTFNNKTLLNGSISGSAQLTTVTGQSNENHTLIDATHFSYSGTTDSGDLATSSTFAAVATTAIGKTAGSVTLDFTGFGGGAVNSAVIRVGGAGAGDITFGTGETTAATVADAFVDAARAHSDTNVRSFVYTDNLDGTVTVTSSDLGTSADGISFNLITDGGITDDGVTLGTESIDTSGGAATGQAESIDSTSGGTEGTLRSVSASDITVDDRLQGAFGNATATLSTTGTQNTVAFTVDLNGNTYTSQAVTLFGTGGFNSKGATIKSDQVLTFYNASGSTDDSGEFTDNGFTLTVASSDVTVAGGTQTAFETDLNNIASGFITQLSDVRVNQQRDIILTEDNPTGGDFDITAAATGTTFSGIEGFDAVGTNATGDIRIISDQFGDDGAIGSIGSFAFDTTTSKFTVSIAGEVYTADISDNAASTGGLVDGAGSYDDATNILTVGAGTTIVFHSAATNDGRQLRIDLSNLTDTSIDLSTSAAADVVTEDLNTLFGVSSNPSLTFQVGTSGSNSIGVSLESVATSSIYKNDAGTSKTLDISTLAGATEASDVLDNAIDTVLSRISTVSSGITSFDSAIVTNSVMIQNFDAASSALLDTNFALEATLYAENTLKLNAAASVLAQEQSRLQTILQLVSNI